MSNDRDEAIRRDLQQLARLQRMFSVGAVFDSKQTYAEWIAQFRKDRRNDG